MLTVQKYTMILFCALVLASCDYKKGQKRANIGGNNSIDNNNKEPEVIEEEKILQRDLNILGLQSSYLCSEIDQYKNRCHSSRSLLNKEIFNDHCESDKVIKNDFIVNVTMEPFANFKLVVDDLFESEIINSESQPVSFHSITGSTYLPRISDVNEIKIVPVDSNVFSGQILKSFELSMNGSLLIIEENRTLAEDSLNLNMQNIYKNWQSESCRTDENKIDERLTEIASNYSDASNSSGEQSQSLEDTYNQALSQFDQLKDDLLKDKNRRCHLSADIQDLKLLIKGRKNRVLLGRENIATIENQNNVLARYPQSGTNISSQINLDLGGVKTTINYGEAALNEDIPIQIDLVDGATIASLSKVRLEKEIDYELIPIHCKHDFISAWFDGKENCEVDVYEKNQFVIDDISILANGIPIYTKTGLAYELNHRQSTYNDFEITQNKSWIQMERRSDCTYTE